MLVEYVIEYASKNDVKQINNIVNYYVKCILAIYKGAVE